MPKLPSTKFGGYVTILFEAHAKDPTHPTFTELTIGQWNFLFNYWKEDLIVKTYPILIPDETPVIPTLTVISSNLTGNISTLSPILEETFILSTPVMVTYKTKIVELFTVS